MRVFGFLLVLTLVLLGIANGGELSAFFDLTAVLIVLGTTIGGFLMAAGPQTGQAIGAAFSGSASDDRVRAGLHGFRGGRFGALVGGFLSVLIGLILVLNNADDPGAIGPGLALMLLGFLWGVFLCYFILLPLQAGMERRLIEAGAEDVVCSEMALDLLVLGGGVLICTVFFAILKAAFPG